MFSIILLVPIGDLSINEDELLMIKDRIAEVFKCEVQVGERVSVPENAFDSLRNQWRAAQIIKYLPEKECCVIGIIEKDLFAPNLNFVFGEAHPATGRAVISTARLKPGFSDEKENQKLFKERIIKEIIHELGHLLGLFHCSDKSCIMYFSNTMSDTDKKGPNFCKRCLLNLK